MDMLRTLFVRLFTQLPGRARNQRGASALEYIVLVALIVVIVVAGISFVDQGTIDAIFQPIEDAFTGAGGGGSGGSGT
ncbi:hypothetical protein [Alcanivorax sp.]|uniref:hypothetical protein n=1 Tax=Alcanivorax sp. TaxID=1872427 RepID=UPI000C0F2E13|nr:hypothetical protein [Alcanivorax sp.]PHR68103.1 MAG: hypothetical protein COA55_02460 [Alcanivorax sp.]